jgi:diadenosine tetraphosphate (Ap4A) HIT family hydrolase
MAALGSFVDGYLLLCSKAHVPSMASLSSEDLAELDSLLHDTRTAVEVVYGPTVVFEHGMASSRVVVGGCIVHAHIHLIPVAADVVGFLSRQFETERLSSLSALSTFAGSGYILVSNTVDELVIARNSTHSPSQFLRKYVAEQAGKGDLWDWAAYLGIAEMERTIRTFEDPQSRRSYQLPFR